MILEYCDGGSLHDLLHKKQIKLSPKQQLEYGLTIAESMEYLHTHQPMIVHCDLKSTNILVNERERYVDLFVFVFIFVFVFVMFFC
jgi:serine/threonine protein kinase